MRRPVQLCPPSRRLVAAALFAAVFGLLVRGGAQERRERAIGPGARLLRWEDPAGPFALQAVEVDLKEPLLSLEVSLGGGDTLALEPVSAQARRASSPTRYAIAGVNGDFFYYPGQRQPGAPTSVAFLGEELVRTPFNRSCLVLPANGTPAIRTYRTDAEVTLPTGDAVKLDGVNQTRGPAQAVLYTPRWGATTRTDATGVEVFLAPEAFPLKAGVVQPVRVRAVQSVVGDGAIQAGCWVLSAAGAPAAALKALAPGDTVRIRVAFDPPVAAGDQILGGGPRLLRDGMVAVEREGGTLGDGFARARHPRTAVGYNGDRLYMLVVDGRQPGFSLGMSLEELAKALLDLGCTDAINLDGGGSSALWARGSLINRPSDGRERPVANSLLLFSRAPLGEAVRLIGPDSALSLLAGASVPLAVTGEDRYQNPVPVAPEALRWSVEAALGRINGGRFEARADATAPAGAEYALTTATVTNGPASGAFPIRVYPRPARLEIRPASARLAPQSQAVFRVRAFDSRGALLTLPPTVAWEAASRLGQIDAGGTLSTLTPAQGTVKVTVNGVAAFADVEVANGVKAALDDFEGPSEWSARLSAGATGSVRVADGGARSGKRALRLEYDLSAGGGTRAVYALGSRALGRAFAMKVWVFGDGAGAWLRARVKDAKGGVHLFDLARHVDWKGEWRELRLPFSDDLPTPLVLEALYVVETDAVVRPRGVLLFDDLSTDE